MTAVTALVRAAIRGRFAGLLTVALLLTAGLGIALAAIEIADRTERAYPEYLRRAEVADLVVNPVMPTDQVEELIRSVPGVTGLASDSLLTASINRGDPYAAADASLEEEFLQTRVSYNGRYVTQDRPAIAEGRMISSGAEALVNVEAAEHLGIEAGDSITLDFWPSDYDDPTRVGPPPLLGQVPVTVVGIGVFPDEVLADRMLPRLKVLVTSDVGAPFDCEIQLPPVDDPRSGAEITKAVFPETCSMTYRYFSVTTEGGQAGAAAVVDAMATVFDEASREIPAGLLADDVRYGIIPSFTSDDAERIRQSLSPAVTALRVFGIVAGTSSIVVVALLAFRLMRRRETDVAVWQGLGLTRSERALALGVPLAIAAGAGVVGGALLAWAAASIGPVASARAVDPHHGPGLSTAIVLPGIAMIAAFAAALAAAAAVASRARSGTTLARRSRPSFWAASRSPSRALGMRAATSGRSAGAVLVGSALAVAAIAGTLVFSASVSGLIDRPEEYGWPYDAAVLVNAGYGATDLDAVAASLDRPEVAGWGAAALSGGPAVNGTSVPYLAEVVGLAGSLAPTVISGRAPHGSDEIALGARTAAAVDVDVGDEVDVTMPYGERAATVTGLVLLPALGPLESDRTSIGKGAFFPARFFEALLADGEDELGIPAQEIAAGISGLVVIDMAEGQGARAFLDGLGDEVSTWDPSGFPGVIITEPLLPDAISDVHAMRDATRILAILFVLSMAASLVAGIAAGTRARQRELALLRAFGGTPRQIRASIRWHGLVVVAVALVAGLPVGLIGGRIAYTAFARDIGAAPRPDVPLGLLVALAGVVLAIGLFATLWPARQAGGRRHLELLRQEAALSTAGRPVLA